MPIESGTEEFPITLKVPHQRFVKRFHSQQEVDSWIRAEIQRWSEMNNFSQSQVFPEPNQHLAFLRLFTTEPLGQALGAGSAGDILSSVERRGIILLEGKQGLELQKIYSDNPTLYPGAFAAIVADISPIQHHQLEAQGARFPLPWPILMSGLGAVVRLNRGARSLNADRREIDELILQGKDALGKLETAHREMGALQSESKGNLDELTALQRRWVEDSRLQYTALFQSKLDESAARIAELEDQVRSRLMLEAPTTYWSNKARSHRNTALLFGAAFLIALGAGVYWLTHNGVALVGDAYQTIVGDRENPGLLALVPLAFITLPTLAFAWLLRHVSRIIVQNLSLQADAELRGTIATTYSALTAHQGATQAELAIALNALFRPVDGSGHAEIAPPNVRDILEMGK